MTEHNSYRSDLLAPLQLIKCQDTSAAAAWLSEKQQQLLTLASSKPNRYGHIVSRSVTFRVKKCAKCKRSKNQGKH
jgi:hypothetical protein